MAELVIDIGNTRIKAARFENGVMLQLQLFAHNDAAFEQWCAAYAEEPAIVSSVAPGGTAQSGLSRLRHLHRFSYRSKLPFVNAYRTPHTLGPDRMAVVAGARSLYPEGPLLCIDAGTCITYDLVNEQNEYLGGAISPGLNMRYTALHQNTGRLPLVEHREYESYTGSDTEESILAGVQQGIVAEAEHTVAHYRSIYPRLQVTLSGGDTAFFEKRLKCNIFAYPQLVVKGLYHILKLNEA
jgi:type III pantothenate kinase